MKYYETTIESPVAGKMITICLEGRIASNLDDLEFTDHATGKVVPFRVGIVAWISREQPSPNATMVRRA